MPNTKKKKRNSFITDVVQFLSKTEAQNIGFMRGNLFPSKKDCRDYIKENFGAHPRYSGNEERFYY